MQRRDALKLIGTAPVLGVVPPVPLTLGDRFERIGWEVMSEHNIVCNKTIYAACCPDLHPLRELVPFTACVWTEGCPNGKISELLDFAESKMESLGIL